VKSRFVCKRCSASFQTTYWIALRPLGLPGLTKHYFQVLVSTMTVPVLLPWKCSKRFYILGFDQPPDRETDEEHISLPHQGNVRIEARFNKPLPEPVT
jgi:hypothetical protein